MRIVENYRTHQLAFSVGQALADERSSAPACRHCGRPPAHGWASLCTEHAGAFLDELGDAREQYSIAA